MSVVGVTRHRAPKRETVAPEGTETLKKRRSKLSQNGPAPAGRDRRSGRRGFRPFTSSSAAVSVRVTEPTVTWPLA